MTGEKIKLRALEPEDLEFLFALENDESLWEVSHTLIPFSRFILKQYIENSNKDIYEAKQLRLIIERKSDAQTLGAVDLFDFDPYHKRAGVGIVLLNDFKKKGYAKDALATLITYAFNKLNLHQLYASMTADNLESKQLFEKLNFQLSGIKKDWICSQNGYKDELFYQLIHE